MDRQEQLLRELDDVDDILRDLREGIAGESLESETYKLMVTLYTQRRQAYLNELTAVKAPQKGAAYIMFGGFNPPTVAHEQAIQYMIQTAGSVGADAFVFASSQENNRNNPVGYDDKLKFLSRFFPDARVHTGKRMQSVFDALHVIKGLEYTTVNLFVRDDKEMKMAVKIKQRVDTLPVANFDVIVVPEKVSVTDVAMRRFAAKNDFASFRKNLPTKADDNDAMQLFDSVRNFSVGSPAI